MEFAAYLKQALQLHPVMEPTDIVKHCYQSAFGGAHMLCHAEQAKAYFQQEFAAVTAEDGALYEQISPFAARISLKAWKAKHLPSDWLWRIFSISAAMEQPGEAAFAQYLAAADTIARELGMIEWESYLRSYRAEGLHAVHHSAAYRAAEAPAYRVVSARFLPLLPIFERIAALPKQDVTVIAIDGRAASGKSSAAELLRAVLDAGLVHMDDFFLPPVLRSEQRLALAGGNVHHERFAEEVLPQLRNTAAFSYRRFDCSRMDMGELREVKSSPIRIVEGSYSHHPALGRYADLHIFSDVASEEQQRRILARNGERMLEMFRSRWIPMEERYFAEYAIRENADLIIRNDT